MSSARPTMLSACQRLTSRSYACIFAAAALAVSVLAACGGGGGATTPTPVLTLTPSPDMNSPTPAPPSTPYRLVYREYGDKEDTIWWATPWDPPERKKLASIPHREGFGVVASLSADGRMLAYLSLPDNAISETSSQAEAYVLDLKTNNTRLLTGGLDYTFRPLWSPDGQLLFMRRLAGPEILAADVSIIYTKVEREPLEGEPTPTPTPKPTPVPPDQTPAPSPVPEDPIKTIMKAKYSQVQSFIPIGWADDQRSLFFVQVDGGLQGATLVGEYAPATAESIAKEATPTPDPAATPAPPPDPGAPPTPTPTPNSKFVVQLTDQTAADYGLSPDLHKVTFSAGGLVDADFVNQVFIADLIAGTVTPIQTDGLPPGSRLGPVWYPDSSRITVGVQAFAGRGAGAVLVPLPGGPPEFLAAAPSGFDVPLGWAPDGSYLAVTNWSGPDLDNRGEPSLDIVAPTGQRMRVAQGKGYATGDAAIGWIVTS